MKWKSASHLVSKVTQSFIFLDSDESSDIIQALKCNPLLPLSFCLFFQVFLVFLSSLYPLCLFSLSFFSFTSFLSLSLHSPLSVISFSFSLFLFLSFPISLCRLSCLSFVSFFRLTKFFLSISPLSSPFYLYIFIYVLFSSFWQF